MICSACDNYPGEPCAAIVGAITGHDLGIRYCPLYATAIAEPDAELDGVAEIFNRDYDELEPYGAPLDSQGRETLYFFERARK
jgi:hypothetical protein